MKFASCLELHQINLTFDQMTSRQISSNCFGQVIKFSFLIKLFSFVFDEF